MSEFSERVYSSREDPGKYSLTDKQRKYLIEGDPSEYSEGTLDKQLANRSEKIPDRLEYLSEDIALLSENGYVQENFTEENWQGLVEAACDEIPTHDLGILFNSERELTDEMRIGFWLGRNIRQLFHSSPDGSRKSEIVLGVALSLLGNSPNISSLPQIRERLQVSEQKIQGDIEEAEVDKMREAARKIEDIATKRHEEVQGVIQALEMSKYKRNKFEGLIEREMRSREITPNKFLVGVILAILSEIEKSTGETPQTEEIDEEITRLERSTPLRGIENLRSEMASNEKEIDIKYRGIVVEDLLEKCYRETGEITKDDTLSKWSRHVTGALNRLSEDEESSLWTNRPIVRRKSERTWALTVYGELFCYILFECGGSAQVLYEYAVYSSLYATEVTSEYSDSLKTYLSAIKTEHRDDINELIHASLEHEE